ncbi:OmpA family protein [Niastella sp. OAS944]|uniref:OmpA family protein n=1 Tax=Niastella sp. OAS944 TaxID=2664089 RepID=UPI00347D8CCC|nr:outer membrane protein OmpA-like peptidoglycan-associated protein [Chitinophagaceae bacterium OAS944]
MRLTFTLYCFCLLLACVVSLPGKGQDVVKTKSVLQLADQYFAAGEYYTAAYLYEQFLNPSKYQVKRDVFPVYTNKKGIGMLPKNISRSAILYKQAVAYLMANYFAPADSIFNDCTDNINALYWKAVCERSLGQYDEATANLRAYMESTNTNKKLDEEAKAEWETLQYIGKQLRRPDTILANTRKLNMPDSYERGGFAVVPLNGDQYLVTSTKTDSGIVKGTNPHNSHLFQATLTNDSLAQLTPVSFPPTGLLNNQGAASSYGNKMYFTQWQKVNGKTISNIYVITQTNGSWSAPQLVEAVNSNGFSSKQPFITADGKFLYFASDRPGGSGGFDIWLATLQEDGSVGTPINAGEVVNTNQDEQAPFYQTSNNTLVFSTNGRTGMGSFDLFSAKGKTNLWSEPVNLGYPVNSSRDDIYFYAPEKTRLLENAIIGSDRGNGCCIQTYRINKAPKKNNLNGVVLDCKNHKPVADASIVLTTAAGTTRTTTTDINGKYIFDTVDTELKDYTVAVSKQAYRDTVSKVQITKTDETNLLTDQFFNADLCVEKKFVLRPENVVTVYFNFDKYNLKQEAVRKLDSVYNVLLEIPTATLQISGYTDGKGSVEYNAVLSDHRARACAEYFISKGIDGSRITFASFGACCPLEMELINGRDNPDGRSRNRRALINITKE